VFPPDSLPHGYSCAHVLRSRRLSYLHRLEIFVSLMFQLQDSGAFLKTDVQFDRVIELHSIVVEILENFELSFPEGKTILRVPAIAMTCMVEGEREKGVQMPIRIKSLINC
jgi:hypothetical protein